MFLQPINILNVFIDLLHDLFLKLQIENTLYFLKTLILLWIYSITTIPRTFMIYYL